MRYFVPTALVIAAIVHLLPLAGVMGVARLQSLYGVAIGDPNLEILMRHRAVLFGLIGAFLLFAVFHAELQAIALIAGIVSLGAFLGLVRLVGGYNSQITRLVGVDSLTLVVLIAASVIHVLSRGAP